MPQKQLSNGVKFKKIKKSEYLTIRKQDDAILRKANFPRMSEQDLVQQLARTAVIVMTNSKIYYAERVGANESNYSSTLAEWGVPVPPQQAAD